MEIIDKHYKALPKQKKNFIKLVASAFFIMAIAGYFLNFMSPLESYLIVIVGFIFSELLKLRYRVEDLEKKKKK